MDELNRLALQYAENANHAESIRELEYWLERAEFVNQMIDKEVHK